MPKDQSGKKTYVQKYVKNWENEPNFKGWLKEAPDGDPTKAFCNCCKTLLTAHRKTIQDHSNSKKHVQYVKNQEVDATFFNIDKFVKITLSEKRKVEELKIATYLAEHSSVSDADHLAILIKGLDNESLVLQELKLHRTKCSALIKNVLSPSIVEDLLEDIGQSHFSLIVDESTTIDTKKLLCLMIRYFSNTKKRVITTFYRLIEMQAGTSDAIAQAILKQLKTDGLKPDKLLGLGVDGASVNVGCRHSVTTILREINDELIVITCICHSFHLAAEEACKTLPRHLDFMIRETHSWFSHSTKRQLEYAAIYQTIADKLPKKIVQLSNTRWLVRLQAIDSILDQWDALKLHFGITQSNKERCYTASQLHGMFSSPENKLYLTFLKTSLKGVMATNKLFQSDAVDPLKLFEDVNDLLFSYLQMLVVPGRLQKVSRYELATFKFKEYLMNLTCINFGYDFNHLSAGINAEAVTQIKERCRDFLIVLCTELQKRIPANTKILQKISTFSAESATSVVKENITEIASQFKSSPSLRSLY